MTIATRNYTHDHCVNHNRKWTRGGNWTQTTHNSCVALPLRTPCEGVFVLFFVISYLFSPFFYFCFRFFAVLSALFFLDLPTLVVLSCIVLNWVSKRQLTPCTRFCFHFMECFCLYLFRFDHLYFRFSYLAFVSFFYYFACVIIRFRSIHVKFVYAYNGPDHTDSVHRLLTSIRVDIVFHLITEGESTQTIKTE